MREPMLKRIWTGNTCIYLNNDEINTFFILRRPYKIEKDGV